MPEARYFHDPRFMVEPINDPVGLEDDLPNGWDAELGHNPAEFWEFGECLRARAMSARPRAFAASEW